MEDHWVAFPFKPHRMARGSLSSQAILRKLEKTNVFLLPTQLWEANLVTAARGNASTAPMERQGSYEGGTKSRPLRSQVLETNPHFIRETESLAFRFWARKGIPQRQAILWRGCAVGREVTPLTNKICKRTAAPRVPPRSVPQICDCPPTPIAGLREEGYVFSILTVV